MFSNFWGPGARGAAAGQPRDALGHAPGRPGACETLIERQHIRFPNFETYVPPEKDEEHLDDPLTKEEIKLLADKERAYQQTQRQLRKERNEEAKRQRAIARMNRL